MYVGVWYYVEDMCFGEVDFLCVKVICSVVGDCFEVFFESVIEFFCVFEVDEEFY